jgi:hypothetical protein
MVEEPEDEPWVPVVEESGDEPWVPMLPVEEEEPCEPCDEEEPCVALGDEDEELEPWVSLWANATTANARNIAISNVTFFIFSKLLSDLIPNFAEMTEVVRARSLRCVICAKRLHVGLAIFRGTP